MYTLKVLPYLDEYNKKYKQIITVNSMPSGELSNYVKKVNFPKLSPFKENTSCSSYKCCNYVICDFNNKSKFMCVDDIPSLFTFLYENNYTINTELTKILTKGDVKLTDKVLCLFSYNEN
jgi:hypothetical protein|tara:strand:+ start:212 stop:571 length:360 start_codon:yes stop_codon:yes gene_type:complete